MKNRVITVIVNEVLNPNAIDASPVRTLTQVCVPWSWQSIPKYSWEQTVITHHRKTTSSTYKLHLLTKTSNLYCRHHVTINIHVCLQSMQHACFFCIHVHAKSGHELTHFDKKRPKNRDEAIKPAYLPVQKIVLLDYDMQFINSYIYQCRFLQFPEEETEP